ncbi:bifunctional (p)ppGpp synthetase/guanosine-3',5'-bis(diphosphate) 3'-pyrophosphohydrolase [Ruminococcaceae bacterium AM28-23LB]|nr:bifunctional (p)ppGpp synthetase/guanosine-3',5'-bis(diphosphate) 3'-pyrophosphohydrolase [Ruminococcaceae bacterium AM28-23LB]
MEKTQEGLLLHRAYSFAALAHEGQKRKGSPVPYIAHPAEAARILAQAGATAEVICAGLLHDTLEDTSVTPEQLEEAFGLVVRQLVEGCSEDKALS